MGRKRDTTNYQQGDEGDVRFWLPPDLNGKPAVLTKARKRRGDVAAFEGEKGGRSYQSLAMPLELYVARGYITGEQYEAGLRLHKLYRGTLVAGRYATMRFGDGVRGGFDPEAMALVPRDYFRAADAVRGRRERLAVREVCCFDEPAGRLMPWLKSGLDDLHKYFTSAKIK